MKRIEDIMEMDPDRLAEIAQDSSIIVPETLKHDIGVTARALELLEEKQSEETARHRRYFGLAAGSVAAAASIALLLASGLSYPKDTFKDPALAYAQLEETFNLIGSKMNPGLEMAQSVQPMLDNTITKVLK